MVPFCVVSGTQQGAAASLSVSQAIQDDEDLVAASAYRDINGDGVFDGAGDGNNALNLAKMITEPLANLGDNTSVKGFYASIIGKLGVDSQEALRMQNNAGVLQQQVQERKQSVSAVSLDEEMTNMITFQHAYNAAARSMTTVDEMLDRVINNMGLVGR
ncbi:flagellar basal body rod C-terminal domain-containing protein [Radiobacillus deserti]|uniref:flagellar basal body rod C-terminal domain-containing protein n=1 Tax=Radiobacillus deserti TaxID=2594883 RepID=UPI002B202BDF|nr:flagellar basal body rod C-terminal domain-containing protein [Radiobacillus deserti]